jgi:phenylacetaldehyde dehydrogenase
VQEQIFGPVVVAMPFSDPAELVPRANDNLYSLAAGIWTRDISKSPPHRRPDRRRNRVDQLLQHFRRRAPLRRRQAIQQSGWGREMGHEVLNNYTQTKAVCARN